MPETQEPEICIHCKQGLIRERMEEIAFHQSTDKGYVFSRATILVRVCDNCGSKSWDEAAEGVIEEAHRRAYNKLP
jgi:hypothetical protein